MIEQISSTDKPVVLRETIGTKYQEKTFSSFKALEKALQVSGISNKVRYPLLKYGKVFSVTEDGTKITLEIKYATIETQQETARDTQLGQGKEGSIKSQVRENTETKV